MALSDRQKKELKQAIANDNLASVVSEIINNLIAGVGVDLASAKILVGNASGVSAPVSVSGDIAIDNAGAVTIQALAVETGMIALKAVDTGQIADDAVENGQIADNAVSIENMDSGCKPILLAVAAEDADTSSREENVDGLASALALDAALFITMNAHAADGVEHDTADTVNFPLVEASTDIASLIVAVTEKIAAYVAHDADAALALPAFHDAQTAANALASAVAPINLQECITRLNDIKAKYNLHEADATSHDVGSAHTEAQADAAYGVANLFPVAGVLPGDIVSWSILNDGMGNVTGVSAVADTDGIVFTFSADPQNDAIISYCVFRAAS